MGDSPFILVKRGLCSPAQKVKNIEEAGGHAAIIVDDKDEPIDKMFLADDGNGNDISIPAVLISFSDGNKLINYYSQIKIIIKRLLYIKAKAPHFLAGLYCGVKYYLPFGDASSAASSSIFSIGKPTPLAICSCVKIFIARKFLALSS